MHLRVLELDLNNLTVEDVDRFAEEIAADQSGSVTKAKGAEKAVTVSKKSAQETKEYDKLSALTFEVGSALGVRQLPEETSDKYFERIKGKASEIMSDTYRSQGVYKSKSGNEENARLRRILEFGTPTNRGALYQEASRAYNDFIDAVEELESARK
jgi:Tfp pilus assembly protein PilW